MRLRTLPVSVAGVVAATGYCVVDGTFKPVPALLCLVFAVLCQIASNFANEYFDFKAGRDRAGREGPRRGVTEGDIAPSAMLRATYTTLCLAALAGLTLTYWGGAWLIAVGEAVAVGVFAYSAGPFPLSTHCLGEAGVIVFFGLVPVNFTYYVQTLHWSVPVLSGSLSTGLMIANVLIVNNHRDRDDDRDVGKHTLATAMPRWAMPVLYAVNAIIACVLMLGMWSQFAYYWAAVPALYTACSLGIAYRLMKYTGRRLNPLLGMTAMLVFAYSLCFLIAAVWR